MSVKLYEWEKMQDPPEMTPEIESKLEKTAELLQEIAEMWSIPDLGMCDINDMPLLGIDPMNEDNAEHRQDELRRQKNFRFNWYQRAPFVPLFFNAQYYAILMSKMLPYRKEQKND